jgi:Tfp pilus assembly protein PilX
MIRPRRRSGGRAEDGYVLVFVLAVLVVALTIGAAALALTLHSSDLTTHNMRVRRAQQAADAGVQAQVYRQTEADLGSTTYNLNGGPLGLSTFVDCLVPQLNVNLQVTGIATVAAGSAGVCPTAVNSSNNPITNYSSSLGNHTSYQSELLPGRQQLFGSAADELNPKIVSIGNETSTIPAGSGAVYSREEAILAPIVPLQAVEGSNSVAITGASIGTSGFTILGIHLNISVVNNAAGVINGDVFARGTASLPLGVVGTNLSLTSGSILSTIAAQTITGGTISTAQMQTGVGSQIPQRLPVTVGDTKSDCPSTGCPTGYSSTTRAFSQTTNVSTTFKPGDYVFCGFNATAGTLSTTGTGPVRIFIRSPSSPDCAGDTGDAHEGQFNDPVGFNNTLTGTINGLDPSGLQIYNAGSGAVTIGGNGTVNASCANGTTVLGISVCLSVTVPVQAMIVYAPSSTVSVNTTGCVANVAIAGIQLANACTAVAFDGAAVGNQTSVTAAAITQDLDIGNFPLYAGVNAYRVTQYVQCDDSVQTLAQTTSDTSGC